MNAIMHANHISLAVQECVSVWGKYWMSNIFSEPIVFCMYNRITRRGRDPANV